MNDSRPAQPLDEPPTEADTAHMLWLVPARLLAAVLVVGMRLTRACTPVPDPDRVRDDQSINQQPEAS